jgi:hypothetical protein
MRVLARRLARRRAPVNTASVTDHRQLGVDLFNETWRLIESREDDGLLIDCAHASAYHWALAPECRPRNRARSSWLISRAYTVLGRAEPALFHANRCFELCERHALGDWDLAFAYEALARANRVAGDADAVREYVEFAQAVEIADADDRKHLEVDLKTLV